MRRITLAGCLFLMACMEYKLSAGPEQNDGDLTDSQEDGPGPCEDDAAPSIVDAIPQTSDVLDVDEVVLLEAWVTDDHTPPEELVLRWLDQEDILIDEVTADDSGYAWGSWAPGRESGDQILTIEVRDACDNTDALEIPVCQQGGYESEEFNLEDWHLEGNAEMLSEGELQLTGLAKWEIGSAFMISEIVDAANVEIRFEYLTEGGTGADGISLTALDVDRMTGYLGGHGCGIGYGGDTDCTDGPALPGWSIELDSWYNQELPDPTSSDHVAFTFDGQIKEPALWSAVSELEETGWHTVEIVVSAPHVFLSIDGVVYLDEDVSGDFDFPAYIGFTGSTGGQTNVHWIRSLTVTEAICPEDGSDTDEPDTDLSQDDTEDKKTNDTEYTVEVETASDWGAGYCTDVTVTNTTSDSLAWEVSIAMDGTLNSFWNAQVVEDGSDWVFTGEGWNTPLAVGEQADFGFCADR